MVVVKNNSVNVSPVRVSKSKSRAKATQQEVDQAPEDALLLRSSTDKEIQSTAGKANNAHTPYKFKIRVMESKKVSSSTTTHQLRQLGMRNPRTTGLDRERPASPPRTKSALGAHDSSRELVKAHVKEVKYAVDDVDQLKTIK